MKHALYLLLPLLSIMASVFCSCNEDSQEGDLFLPVYKVYGDAISMEKPDSVAFESKTASLITEFYIYDINEESMLVNKQRFKIYNPPNPSYPRELPERPEECPDVKIVQVNPTTYYMLTTPSYKKKCYELILHTNSKAGGSGYNAPGRVRYYTN